MGLAQNSSQAGSNTREIYHGLAAFVGRNCWASFRIINDVDGFQPAAQVSVEPGDVFVRSRGDNKLELRFIDMVWIFARAERQCVGNRRLPKFRQHATEVAEQQNRRECEKYELSLRGSPWNHDRE